jgi:signal transduction histidine kinase
VSAPEPYASDPRFAAELARQKLLAMKELAYGASHEINNPLANIAARAQALLAGEPDPDRRRSLAVIAAQAFRAHEMIADLMLFAHPPEPVKSRFSVQDLAADVVRELAEEAELQKTSLRLGVATAEPAELLADRPQIAASVRALLRNALEALVQGGEVVLEVVVRNHEIGFHVRDTGPGIPPEIRDRIFDPYFSGREAGRGHGLGLSKAWRIAQLHGGRLTACSGNGPGAEFRLTLPK